MARILVRQYNNCKGLYGYITKTGNGWIQIRLKDKQNEIAKRIYEVSIMSEPTYNR